jgi:hypothetical protein
MQRGALLMPSHPPERAIADGQCWDLTVMGVLSADCLVPITLTWIFVTFHL